MLNITVSFKGKKVAADLNRELDQTVRQISQDYFDRVKAKTPVRSGRARKGWRLKKQRQFAYEVRNRVPYIGRLDEGYSKQAPRGMTRPAAREVLNQARRRYKR
tara:strand:+ start:4849 stop:5160 length:312 start_codon:yes stop_codon:yes gene_type:complete